MVKSGAPADALSQLERQLRNRLGASLNTPPFESTVEASLQSLTQKSLANSIRSEAELDAQTDKIDDALTPLLGQVETRRQELRRLELDRDIAKSLVNSNEADYLRLTSEVSKLNSLAGRCDYGHVEFSECTHIIAWKTTTSLPWKMDQKSTAASLPKLREDLAKSESNLAQAMSGLETLTRSVTDKRAEGRKLQVRRATSVAQRDLLKSLWDEFTARTDLRKQGKDSTELEQAQARKKSLTQDLNEHKVTVAKRTNERNDRREQLKALTTLVAARILGEDGHGRFISDSETRPFLLAREGEAYQVLEVLIGDMVCLLDTATSKSSHHPGFLVHDCPREADMSGRLYSEYLLLASEAESQLSGAGGAPFQYIVTTTSAPPESIQQADALVLELKAGDENDLLFRRRLTTSLPGMEVG